MIPAEIVVTCILAGLVYLIVRGNMKRDVLREEIKALRQERDDLARQVNEYASAIIRDDAKQHAAPRPTQPPRPRPSTDVPPRKPA